MSSNWEKRKNAKKFATDAECGMEFVIDKLWKFNGCRVEYFTVYTFSFSPALFGFLFH
jgi:hypothetical protein